MQITIILLFGSTMLLTVLAALNEARGVRRVNRRGGRLMRWLQFHKQIF